MTPKPGANHKPKAVSPLSGAPLPLQQNAIFGDSAQAIKSALELQTLLLNAAKHAKSKDLTTLAQVSRAWCELQETIRRLKMKPLPKAIDVQALRSRKNKRSTLTYSEDEGLPTLESPTDPHPPEPGK